MSDETQANPLFAPFVPPAGTGEPMTFTEAPAVPAKRGRKKQGKPAKLEQLPGYQEAAASMDPPASVKRKYTKKAALKQPTQKRNPKPPKQPVAPEQVARPKASSLDLQTVLRACAGLKDEDFAAFDALFNLPAVQRERVLAAIGKVFS